LSNADAELGEFLASADRSGSTHVISHRNPVTESTESVDVRFVRSADALLAEVGSDAVALDRPVLLDPVTVPKPWGQEIWYTGMEARGESRVVDVNGARMSLSLYLALAPEHLCRGQDVLLLKILDPKPEEVLGDLYFEVHAQKEEVYVVTHVDRSAWPSGKGAIRFGMDQDKRRALGDAELRTQFRRAVADYAHLRSRIDDAGEHIPPDQEAAARATMEAFTAMHELGLGDVVKVPTWLPHSLQHGVRVVEFQTPTYERFIISFAQKVLTQDHWDYEHAIDRMTIDAPAPEQFEQVAPGVERIARFADFNVWRVSCETASAADLPGHIPYAVCMAIGDEATVGSLALPSESACFVPASALPSTLQGGPDTQILVAAPGL
jgi:hypothetical protein